MNPQIVRIPEEPGQELVQGEIRRRPMAPACPVHEQPETVAETSLQVVDRFGGPLPVAEFTVHALGFPFTAFPALHVAASHASEILDCAVSK